MKPQVFKLGVSYLIYMVSRVHRVQKRKLGTYWRLSMPVIKKFPRFSAPSLLHSAGTANFLKQLSPMPYLIGLFTIHTASKFSILTRSMIAPCGKFMVLWVFRSKLPTEPEIRANASGIPFQSFRTGSNSPNSPLFFEYTWSILLNQGCFAPLCGSVLDRAKCFMF